MEDIGETGTDPLAAAAARRRPRGSAGLKAGDGSAGPAGPDRQRRTGRPDRAGQRRQRRARTRPGRRRPQDGPRPPGARPPDPAGCGCPFGHCHAWVMFATVSTPTSLDLPDGVAAGLRSAPAAARSRHSKQFRCPGSASGTRRCSYPATPAAKRTSSRSSISWRTAAGGSSRSTCAGSTRRPGPMTRMGTRSLRVGSDILAVIRGDRRAARARSFIRRPGRPRGCAGQHGWQGPGRHRLADADELGPGHPERAAGGRNCGPCWPLSASRAATCRTSPGCRPQSPRSGGPTWNRRRWRRASRARACVPGQADEAQRPERARARGPVPPLRPGPDAGPRAAAAGEIPMLVLYGENDNAWSPRAQENMARRLGPAGCASPGPRTPPRWRPRRRPRAR